MYVTAHELAQELFGKMRMHKKDQLDPPEQPQFLHSSEENHTFDASRK
jgi:hypothetical protein